MNSDCGNPDAEKLVGNPIRGGSVLLTLSEPGPGPLMVVAWVMAISPVVSVMVAGYVRLKSIVSPSLAIASAWRNEPAPLSLVFVTVMVAA